jgi:hypothetical protein
LGIGTGAEIFGGDFQFWILIPREANLRFLIRGEEIKELGQKKMIEVRWLHRDETVDVERTVLLRLRAWPLTAAAGKRS